MHINETYSYGRCDLWGNVARGNGKRTRRTAMIVARKWQIEKFIASWSARRAHKKRDWTSRRTTRDLSSTFLLRTLAVKNGCRRYPHQSNRCVVYVRQKLNRRQASDWRQSKIETRYNSLYDYEYPPLVDTIAFPRESSSNWNKIQIKKLIDNYVIPTKKVQYNSYYL